MNWMAIGSVILIVAGTIMGYYATSKSDKSLDNVQTELRQIKDYSIYATMNIYGTAAMVFGSGGLQVTTVGSDLFTRMSQFLTVMPGNETANIKEDPNLLPEIDAVIERYPLFPWGYYVKAIILRASQNSQWRIPANKAIEIFKITTSIQGHAPAHDDALRNLESLLNNAIP